MASFARRRPPAAWSVDDASTFAALKEFKLLQLLSADKKAFATARRLALGWPLPSQLNRNRNKLRPQGQPLRAQRHVFRPMLRRVRRRGRTPASGAVQRAARSTMRSGNSRCTAWLSLFSTSVVSSGGVGRGGYVHSWLTSSLLTASR